MNRKHKRIACLIAGSMIAGAPAWAISLGSAGPAQPLPDPYQVEEAQPVSVAQVSLTTGSASLVPLMAADAEAQNFSSIDASEPARGGDSGKPVDDLSFVERATESGRQEVRSAEEALTRLSDPDLRKVAEVLAHHHGAANARLVQIAEAKGWPVPDANSDIKPPPTGTATPDYDARWTDDMIAGHEHALALYRAQAQGGEDKDLRKYARETLPTIEQHLDWLRSLQK
jgi:putative membrane protein